MKITILVFLSLLSKAKLPWLRRLIKFALINFWLIFGFWNNFNAITILMVGLNLRESLELRAIIEKLSLKKSFLISVIMKKYYNFKYISWI